MPGWGSIQEPPGGGAVLLNLIAMAIYLVLGLLLMGQMLMRLALVDALLDYRAAGVAVLGLTSDLFVGALVVQYVLRHRLRASNPGARAAARRRHDSTLALAPGVGWIEPR